MADDLWLMAGGASGVDSVSGVSRVGRDRRDGRNDAIDSLPLPSEIVGESKLRMWQKGLEAHAKPFFLWPAHFSPLNENRHRVMREGQPQGEGITMLHLSGADDETAVDREVYHGA